MREPTRDLLISVMLVALLANRHRLAKADIVNNETSQVSGAHWEAHAHKEANVVRSGGQDGEKLQTLMGLKFPSNSDVSTDDAGPKAHSVGSFDRLHSPSSQGDLAVENVDHTTSKESENADPNLHYHHSTISHTDPKTGATSVTTTSASRRIISSSNETPRGPAHEQSSPRAEPVGVKSLSTHRDVEHPHNFETAPVYSSSSRGVSISSHESKSGHDPQGSYSSASSHFRGEPTSTSYHQHREKDLMEGESGGSYGHKDKLMDEDEMFDSHLNDEHDVANHHETHFTSKSAPVSEKFEDSYIDTSDPHNPMQVHVKKEVKSSVGPNSASLSHQESEVSHSLNGIGARSFKRSSSSSSFSSSRSSGGDEGSSGDFNSHLSDQKGQNFEKRQQKSGAMSLDAHDHRWNNQHPSHDGFSVAPIQPLPPLPPLPTFPSFYQTAPIKTKTTLSAPFNTGATATAGVWSSEVPSVVSYAGISPPQSPSRFESASPSARYSPYRVGTHKSSKGKRRGLTRRRSKRLRKSMQDAYEETFDRFD